MLTSTGNHLLPVNASPARLSRLQATRGGGIRRGYGFDGRGRRWGQGGGFKEEEEGWVMGEKLPGECRHLLVELFTAGSPYKYTCTNP